MKKLTKDEKREILDMVTDNPLLIIIYPIMVAIMAPIFIGYLAIIQFQNWVKERPIMNYMKERYGLEQYNMLLEEEVL